MAIPVTFPTPRPAKTRVVGARAGKSRSKIGSVLGAAAALGAGAATGGVGLAAGLSLAGAGAGLGGLAGGFFDKAGSAGQTIQEGVGRASAVPKNAISRRMDQVQPDSLQKLGSSLQALGQAPEDIQQQYLAPLLKAYQTEFERQGGGIA